MGAYFRYISESAHQVSEKKRDFNLKVVESVGVWSELRLYEVELFQPMVRVSSPFT